MFTDWKLETSQRSDMSNIFIAVPFIEIRFYFLNNILIIILFIIFQKYIFLFNNFFFTHLFQANIQTNTFCAVL